MVAGAVMAMMAMIASVTYQHHGLFTPLFHISALFGSPDSMMRSVAEAISGHRVWFTAAPAAAGLLIHMVTGALFGIAFVTLTRRVRVPAHVMTGAGYGLVVFAFSAFVGLPLAAAVTGSGATISDMASMVGWVTFAAEHVMFGAVVGLLAGRTIALQAGSGDAVGGAGAAKLSR
jgi:hypothetical protein